MAVTPKVLPLWLLLVSHCNSTRYMYVITRYKSRSYSNRNYKLQPLVTAEFTKPVTSVCISASGFLCIFVVCSFYSCAYASSARLLLDTSHFFIVQLLSTLFFIFTFSVSQVRFRGFSVLQFYKSLNHLFYLSLLI